MMQSLTEMNKGVRMRAALLLAFWFFAITPLFAGVLADGVTGLVTEARAKNTKTCTDGVGVSGTFDEFDAAVYAEDLGRYLPRHEACVTDDDMGRSLRAECSPSTPIPGTDSVAIYCAVHAWNPPDARTIVLDFRRFALVTDTMRFPVDRELTSMTGVVDNLVASTVQIEPGQSDVGIVAFRVPVAIEDDPMLLIWDAPGQKFKHDNGIVDPRILLNDREPELLNELTIPASTPVAGEVEQTSGSLTLAGVGDSVEHPIDMTAGLYIVSASNAGDSNFQVWAFFPDGSKDLPVNEIGPYEGQSTFEVLTDGPVIFQIEAEGSWRVTFKPAF